MTTRKPKPTPRSPDDAIDRALAVLRNAEPVEGLEMRILTSLRHRESGASTPARSFRRRWIPALSVATAFALLAAFLLRAPHQGVLPLPTSTPKPNLISTTSTKMARQPFAQRHRRHALVPRVPPPSELGRLSSFPAPPAPLTIQEKLLLQVAQRRDPQDLELLNPETAARELAQNMAAFDRFFPAPTSSETPTPTPSSTPNQESPQ